MNGGMKGRRDGKTPLHWAARNGRVAVVRMLIEDYGVPPDIPSADGSTPLHLACYTGQKDCVDLLLELGADLHKTNKYDCGVQHWCAMGGNVKMAVHLLSKGVDFASSSQANGQTPLHKAAMKGNESMCDWLRKVNVNVDGGGKRKNADGLRADDIASMKKRRLDKVGQDADK